jgi:hypothetical protein
MKVAVRIEHHPSRSALLPRLLTALEDFDDVQVVPDPDPRGKPDSWRAFRACLASMPADASTLLCVQDDALPCDDFVARMTAWIQAKPESVLLAFTPGFPREARAAMLAQRTGASFFVFQPGSYVPLVCTAFPREVVQGFLAWADAKGGDGVRRPLRGADDGATAMFFRKRRIRPLSLVPSLCQHDESVESVGKQTRKGAHRRAAVF